MLLEIAVFNMDSAILAAASNADRLELCDNIYDGGTTPSYALLEMAVQKLSIPVFPMIRPRGGDFLYSETDFQIMLKDIHYCKNLGYTGIVTGLLDKNGHIDTKRLNKLVEAAYPMDVTFHRAFDRCMNPFESLEKIIDCGCERILTSGQQPNAIMGKDLIKALIEKAENRITIIAGSGVRKENILDLARYTGAIELHTSARKDIPSHMEFTCESMQENISNVSVDCEEIRAMKKIISS
ncbi:MAG: copper homeostasis protein CutC [Bacteroidetes bacterium]|nr:copper homeostasis protein CutC [Bacteroidota bacterium]